MDYDLPNLKLLFVVDPDNEDIAVILLLKLLDMEQELAEAAELHRLMHFSVDALPELNFNEQITLPENYPVFSLESARKMTLLYTTYRENVYIYYCQKSNFFGSHAIFPRSLTL